MARLETAPLVRGPPLNLRVGGGGVGGGVFVLK